MVIVVLFFIPINASQLNEVGMNISGTLQSIVDFSNFFDHQMFVYSEQNKLFCGVKNGLIKEIKFPPHLEKMMNDRKIHTKTIGNSGESSVLHIYRLGDGHTLFINDPGTGNVVNSFILSLITLSSNVCDFSEPGKKDNSQVMLDRLVADFDKERMKFSVTDKRRKEEIIILEEQAKEAYCQMDDLIRQIREKDNELSKLRKQFSELAESHKGLEKKLKESHFTSDFRVGSELKKKNETLRANNRKLVDMMKKNSLAFDELHSELEMCLKDFCDNESMPKEKQKRLLSSVNELFSSDKKIAQ